MPSASLRFSDPRFICDEQLGRLAKWLRLQGFDTLYECPIDDLRLIQLAQTQKRVLLTRDQDLSARTLWPHVIVIEKIKYPDQILELSKKIRLPKRNSFTRCLSCNEQLKPLPKSQVQARVPPEVYHTYHRFCICSSCQKIFWQGSHVRASRQRLSRMGR